MVIEGITPEPEPRTGGGAASRNAISRPGQLPITVFEKP